MTSQSLLEQAEPALQRFYHSVVADQEEKTARLLAEKTPMAAVRAALDAIASVTALSDDLKAKFQPRLDCSKGCAFCCFPPVSANLPEVINLVAYIRSQKSPEQAEAIHSRVRKTAELTRSMTAQERHSRSLACPYLEDGSCSVYPARPLACRGFNSADVSACEAGYEDPTREGSVPSFLPLLLTAQAIKDGLRRGLKRAGLEHRLVDLTKASEILLEDVDQVTQQWLDGEPVFARARAFELTQDR